MFHTVSDDDRLSKKSAKFVDVIHTAGLWKGMDEPVRTIVQTDGRRPDDNVLFFLILTQSGHVDFYPNRGVASMPGCEGESVSINCSHHRAPVSYPVRHFGCLLRQREA